MNKSQKDIVFEVLKEVLGKSYSPTESMKPYFGHPKGSDEWRYTWGKTAETMEEAIDKLFTKYKKKQLVIDREFENDNAVKSYLKNLIFNWLNKDRRLNGGKHYKTFKESMAKNPTLLDVVDKENLPTVRLLLKDKQLEEMFELLAQFKNKSEGLEVIKASIIERVIELTKSKNNLKKVA